MRNPVIKAGKMWVMTRAFQPGAARAENHVQRFNFTFPASMSNRRAIRRDAVRVHHEANALAQKAAFTAVKGELVHVAILSTLVL